MEDLRARVDSITPPYPTFGEFMRTVLAEGQRPSDIASRILYRNLPIHEETVTGWASDHSPGNNLEPLIRQEFGYDFAEYRFSQIAQEIGFPPPDAPPQIRAIRTIRALRAYIHELVPAQITVTILTAFVGFKHASLLQNFMNKSDMAPAPESFRQLLRKLPELPRHLRGEVLSPFTSMAVLAELVSECQLKSGLPVIKFAERGGLKYTYVRYLIEAHRNGSFKECGKKSGYTKDPSQRDDLLRVLKEECRRYQIGPYARHDDGEVETPSAETETSTPSLVVAADEVVAPVCPVVTPPTTIPSPPSYLSPFSPRRWHEHQFPVDDARVKTVRALVTALCEELGLLASIEDEEVRARIRAQLNDALMIELMGAIEGFCQKYPGAALRIIEGWRVLADNLKR